MGRRVGSWASLALLAAAVGLVAACKAPAARADDPGAPDSASLQTPVDTTLQDATTDALSAGWKYRIDMTAPANDHFAITDRDFYLYFRPDSAAVHFQVKNRRGTAARILWDECRFTNTDGREGPAVHRGITYEHRNSPQEPTWIQPNATYPDYLIPVDLLLDPNAAAGGQVRELLPTDVRARSMVGKIFGCRLVIEYPNDNRKVEYDCTFKVASTFRE